MIVVRGRCFMMLFMFPSDLVCLCIMLVSLEWGVVHGPCYLLDPP
jgi:hypothetical protein